MSPERAFFSSMNFIYLHVSAPLWRTILIEKRKSLNSNIVISLCLCLLLCRLWCFRRSGRFLRFQFHFSSFHPCPVLLTDFRFRTGLFTLASLFGHRLSFRKDISKAAVNYHLVFSSDNFVQIYISLALLSTSFLRLRRNLEISREHFQL